MKICTVLSAVVCLFVSAAPAVTASNQIPGFETLFKYVDEHDEMKSCLPQVGSDFEKDVFLSQLSYQVVTTTNDVEIMRLINSLYTDPKTWKPRVMSDCLGEALSNGHLDMARYLISEEGDYYQAYMMASPILTLAGLVYSRRFESVKFYIENVCGGKVPQKIVDLVNRRDDDYDYITPEIRKYINLKARTGMILRNLDLSEI